MHRFLIKLWRWSLPWQRFLHFQSFPLTGLLVLLGVATTSRQIEGRQFLMLMITAMAVHIPAFVLNDVIDLPVDRLRKDRALYPLVSGTIRPRLALGIAGAQVPIAFLATGWLGASASAHAALGAALVLLTLYNIWGKLNPLPIITDVIQGLGWAALVVYGALIGSGAPTSLTWQVVAMVVVTITVMNGTHGALRDIRSDRAAGRFTTAMLLGVEPLTLERLLIPRRLKVYMFSLLILGTVQLAYLMADNAFGFGPPIWWLVASVLALLQLFTLGSSFLLVQQRSAIPFNTLGYLYWHSSLLCLPFPFLMHVDGSLRLALLSVILVPVLIYDYTYAFFLEWGRIVHERLSSIRWGGGEPGGVGDVEREAVAVTTKERVVAHTAQSQHVEKI